MKRPSGGSARTCQFSSRLRQCGPAADRRFGMTKRIEQSRQARALDPRWVGRVPDRRANRMRTLPPRLRLVGGTDVTPEPAVPPRSGRSSECAQRSSRPSRPVPAASERSQLTCDGADRFDASRRRIWSPSCTSRRARNGAAARDHRAGGPRRLRPDGAHARPPRCRRRAPPARIRDLRWPRRRVRAVVRPRAGAAARRHAAHGPFLADAAPGRGADGALRRSRARDRDDRNSAPAARRIRDVRRGEDPSRPARSTCAAQCTRCSRTGEATGSRRPPAVDVRPHLARARESRT